ncbi:MAG: NAD(P)/FAD-dependent oxidoreductase [Pseudomonadota bacterium]
MQNLNADYLVIGCGAVSMAFVDTMLVETDATFVIVDDRHMPGGHWNDAYSFVRLHQPSAYYGVSSKSLGSQRIDTIGSNKGFYEMASGAEVLAYFEQVMRETFLPSGRVTYLPMCRYQGDGEIRSLVSKNTYHVSVAKSVVDGTFYKTSIPATHTPKFDVEEGVHCIIPNELPRRAAGAARYTVLGGGKTGMDALIWLLDNQVEPDRISWVCPRDSWLINRRTTQPGAEFFADSVGGFASQLEAIKDASSTEEIFLGFEACGAMLRVDRERLPTMFHYATISQGEIDQLRRIDNVIRQGRIATIGPDTLTTVGGESIKTSADTLYIDCTATAVGFDTTESVPVFQDGLITLQALRAPLVTFSAALAAFVEARVEGRKEKNKLCAPVILADNPDQYLASFAGNMMNQKEWNSNKVVRDWTNQCRLSPLGATVRDMDPENAEQMSMVARIRDSSMPAVMNLFKLIAQNQAA